MLRYLIIRSDFQTTGTRREASAHDRNRHVNSGTKAQTSTDECAESKNGGALAKTAQKAPAQVCPAFRAKQLKPYLQLFASQVCIQEKLYIDAWHVFEQCSRQGIGIQSAKTVCR